jgi:hypothetical protein
MSVYCIRPTICYEAGDWYIGSTKQKIYSRFSKHKSDYRNWLNGKTGLCYSYHIFDKYGVDNCEAVVLESNISYDDLRWRERFYLEKYRAINKHKKPIITEEERKTNKREYYQNNRDLFTIQQNAYREANCEKIKEYGKSYYEANRDRIKAYQEANKDRIKEYAKLNHDKKMEQQRERRKLQREAQKNNSI